MPRELEASYSQLTALGNRNDCPMQEAHIALSPKRIWLRRAWLFPIHLFHKFINLNYFLILESLSLWTLSDCRHVVSSLMDPPDAFSATVLTLAFLMWTFFCNFAQQNFSTNQLLQRVSLKPVDTLMDLYAQYGSIKRSKTSFLQN